MTKFDIENFLAHFFKKDEVVEVNADELQRLVRKSRERDREIQRLKELVDKQSYTIDMKNSTIALLEIEKEPVYQLDLSA